MTPIKPVSEIVFLADNSMIPVVPAEYAQQLWDKVKELDKQCLEFAASEAQLRKALEDISTFTKHEHLGGKKECLICQIVDAALSTPPSEALRPWVEFVKEIAGSELNPDWMREQATQLLSSINFPGA